MNQDYRNLRRQMTLSQLEARGIKDSKVLEVFGQVPRENFVPQGSRSFAYQDSPIAIGLGQTISQPYMVAVMTELLEIKAQDKILEIGSGSGYQAAILSRLGARVYTVERIEELAQVADSNLKRLNIKVELKIGDGTLGWEAHAPFSKIIVTAGSFKVPPPLLKQLKVGGVLVIPLGGESSQVLTKITRKPQDEFSEQKFCGCVFVPLVGKYGWTSSS